MAETEVSVFIRSRVCLKCPVVWTPTKYNSLHRCALALIELNLRQIPNTKDVEDYLGKCNIDKIPSGHCPNGYHSPNISPLR
jgi:hypothetical protein